MRLAIVSLMSGSEWGGSEALWYSLAEHALSRGDKVFISTYKWKDNHAKTDALKSKGAQIYFRKKFNGNAGLAEMIRRSLKKRNPSFDKDYQSIINFKPDHIFISQGDNFDLTMHHRALYNLIRKNNIAYSFICHTHSQYGSLPQDAIYPLGTDVFTNAVTVYFISKKQQHLTERKLQQRLGNAMFTWNPISFKIPDVPLDRPAGDAVQFATVGALVGDKGLDTLFEVFGEPQWKTRNYQLNVYGSGAGLPYLENLTGFFGIKEKVTFHGFVNNIQAVWKQNHLMIIPSAGEGLPISLVEAMACGRTAVATDVGGISELLEDNVSGFIAAAPSVKYISEAMERAWVNREVWEEFGAAAQHKLKQVYDPFPEKKIYEFIATTN